MISVFLALLVFNHWLYGNSPGGRLFNATKIKQLWAWTDKSHPHAQPQPLKMTDGQDFKSLKLQMTITNLWLKDRIFLHLPKRSKEGVDRTNLLNLWIMANNCWFILTRKYTVTNYFTELTNWMTYPLKLHLTEHWITQDAWSGARNWRAWMKEISRNN